MSLIGRGHVGVGGDVLLVSASLLGTAAAADAE